MKIRAFLGLFIAFTVSASLAHASDPSCHAIEAAAAKAQQQRAFHSITELEDGTRLELIAIGDTTYMNQGGDWMKIPANAGKLGQAAATAFGAGETQFHDCRKLGSESIAGMATTAWAYSMDAPEIKLFGKAARAAMTTSAPITSEPTACPMRMSSKAPASTGNTPAFPRRFREGCRHESARMTPRSAAGVQRMQQIR